VKYERYGSEGDGVRDGMKER